jgi:regulator of sigma D
MTDASGRQSWLDDATQTPLIDAYTQKLTTFVDALADGRIDDHELSEQEQRLVELMKQIEPQLDDAQHQAVTRLLCELTAYNVMQTLSSVQEARPKTRLNL